MKRFIIATACIAAFISCGPSQEQILEEAALMGQLNVRMFGAKGDGVTDDTEAIQKAIDFLDARGGGKLYFPYTKHGYLLSSPAKEYDSEGRLVRSQLILPGSSSEQR